MRDERSPKDFCGEVTCRQVGRDKEVETITGIMTAAKLFLLSCLVAVVGYFTYRELQVSTLGLVKKIHILFQKWAPLGLNYRIQGHFSNYSN